MPRNLNRRVEVIFPVQSPPLVKRLREEILETYLHDEVAARHMGANGVYTAKARNGGSDSQGIFMTPRHRSAN
jgi:polyphosphate kinase